jgi:uncharacterized protein YraI
MKTRILLSLIAAAVMALSLISVNVATSWAGTSASCPSNLWESAGTPLWIRSGPSTSDHTVGRIPHGYDFYAVCYNSGWLHVEDPTNYPYGYVNRAYALAQP